MCGVTVAASYFKAHMERSHSICVPQTRGVDEVRGGPATDMMSLPRVQQEVKCPVPWCPSVAHSTGRLRKHLIYCHFRSKVAVVQEGTEPLHRCDLCGMHIPAGWIISHRKTMRCNKNTQMR